MKKFFSGFLVLCLSLALLTACGKNGQTGKTVAAGGLTFAKSYSEVYSALTDLGLRVPEDVSVVCVGDRLEANYYRPQPATLTPPLHDLARNVFFQIRWRQKNPRQPARNLLFNSCFQPGQTLAAARNQ